MFYCQCLIPNCRTDLLGEISTYSGVGPWEEHPQTKQTKNRPTNHSKDFQRHLAIKQKKH